MGHESGPRLVEARLELPDPLEGRVELGPGALQGELGLGQLLAAQPHLQLERLDLAEQALLLAAQPGEVPLEGGPPLLDLRSRSSSAARGRPGRGRRRRLLRRRGEREQKEGRPSQQGLAVQVGRDWGLEQLQDRGGEVHDVRRGVRSSGCRRRRRR